MNLGISLIERREVKVATEFRYVMISQDFFKDSSLFLFPLAIQKLGIFLMDAYKIVKKVKRVKEKPLVISVRNHIKGTTLVLAVLE